MRRSRPFSLWALLVVFAWSFGMGWTSLSEIKSETFFLFASQYGLGTAQMLTVAVVAALDLVSFWVVLSPRPIGYRLVVVNLGVSWVVTMTRLAFAFVGRDAFRAACSETAELRGVPLGEEALATATSTGLLLVWMAISTSATILLLLISVKHRAYFLEPGGPDSSASPADRGDGGGDRPE